MRRQQNHAQIGGNKAHGHFFGAGQVCEKFSVAGKTITAKEEGALVDGRRGDRIDTAGRTQFNGSFDIAGGGFTCSARFDAGFNMPFDIVEMINKRVADSVGKRLASPHDLIAALQVQGPRIVSQQLGVANNYGNTGSADFTLRGRLQYDLRSDSRGISHGDTDTRCWARGRRIREISPRIIPGPEIAERGLR